MNDEQMKFYEEEILKCYNEKRKKHILKVRDISLLLCNIAGIDGDDLQIVELAVLLHDISRGKHIEKEFDLTGDNSDTHNETSAKYVDKIKALDNLSANDKEIIKKIILYHRDKKIYDDDCNKKDKRLIAIVRLADKISKVYKCEGDVEKLEDAIEKLDECIENLPDWVKNKKRGCFHENNN